MEVHIIKVSLSCFSLVSISCDSVFFLCLRWLYLLNMWINHLSPLERFRLELSLSLWKSITKLGNGHACKCVAQLCITAEWVQKTRRQDRKVAPGVVIISSLNCIRILYLFLVQLTVTSYVVLWCICD